MKVIIVNNMSEKGKDKKKSDLVGILHKLKLINDKIYAWSLSFEKQ